MILKPLVVDKMGIDTKEHPVLLTEPSLHNKDHRAKMVGHFFEKYQVPALFICKSSVLAAFSCGRSTCLVLESGANTTYAVPIHDGYALQSSMIKCEIGGNYLTKVLDEFLASKGTNIVPKYVVTTKTVNGQFITNYQKFELTTPSYEAFAKQEVVCEIKEALLHLTPDPPMGDTSPRTDYSLPDGTKVVLGPDARRIPELMFTGSAEDNAFIGVHKMIAEAIIRSDLDIRKELYANIVVAGGNTVVPGFVERVQQLVPEATPANTKIKVIAHMPVERQLSAWLGGSILSSLGSFQQMWMSQQEYKENGENMIERKCA